MGHANGAIQRHICSVQLHKGVGTDVGYQVSMHTSTNTCTHSNQVMGPEVR